MQFVFYLKIYMKGDKMKKLYLVCLLFILGLVSFAETYTKTEQREIIKQFGVFQSALKGKKFDKTAEVIYFPLSYEFEDAETASENKSEFHYNFADDEVLSTNELVKLIANTSGKKEKLWKISSKLISATAKIGDVMKLPLNSERLKKLTENYWVSNQKIKNALGIAKLPVSASEGLEKTIKSFK